MNHFRVVKTPPGEAPEWVRDAWVGLVLEAVEDIPGHSCRKAVSGELDDSGSRPHFTASFHAALSVLRDVNSLAADWWLNETFILVPGDPTIQLSFPVDRCEPVD